MKGGSIFTASGDQVVLVASVQSSFAYSVTDAKSPWQATRLSSK